MSFNLSRTYDRYKAGTQKSFEWLTTNAPELRPSQRVEFITRTSNTSAADATTKRIATSELVPLANAIVAAIVEITLDILYVFKDVIAGRRECSGHHREIVRGEHADPVIIESNRTHQHFLNRLEDVYHILSKTYRARQPNSANATERLDAALEKMKNSFRYLDVEDTATKDNQEISANLEFESTKGTIKSIDPTDFMLDDGEEDRSFRIFCLFRDMSDVKRRITEIWKQYAAGDISFVVSCFLTETAFAMINEVAASFEEDLPGLESFDDLLRSAGMGDALCSSTYVPHITSSCKGAEVEAGETATYPDYSYMHAWKALCSMRYVMPWMMLSKADRQSCGAGAEIDLPGHPFGRVLIGLAGDHAGLEHALQHEAALGNADLFTRNLAQFALLPDELLKPIGLVGMTAAYMAIYDVLDGAMGKGLEEGSRILDRNDSMITELLPFLGSTETGFIADPSPFKEFMTRPRRGSEHWEFRNLCSAEQSRLRFSKRTLAALPTLVGSHVRHLVHEVHSELLYLCNSTTACISIAHLYQAAREQGMLDATWPDMEFILDSQRRAKVAKDSKKSFCGNISAGTSSPALSRVKQYLLSMGMSLTQVNLATPKKRPDVPPPGMGAFLVTTSHVDLAVQHISERKKNAKVIVSNFDLYWDMVRRLVKAEPILDPVISDAWQNTKSLSSVQLLTVIQQSAIYGEKDVNMNYAKLHQTCFELMVHIVHISGLGLDSFPKLTAEILWEAADVEQSDMRQRALRRPKMLLRRVAPLINDMIKDRGDHLTKASLGLSSRHIAEDLKPGSLYLPGASGHILEVELDGVTFRIPAAKSSGEQDRVKRAQSYSIETSERVTKRWR